MSDYELDGVTSSVTARSR